MSYRRILAATACVLPLVLTSCGTDDEDNATEGTTENTATQNQSTETQTSDSAPVQPEETQPAESEPAPDNEQNPAGETPPAEETPIEGGIAASTSGDEDQISQLVYGLGGKSLPEMNRFLFDNSCRAYIDRAGGRERLDQQNAELERMDPSGELNATVPIIHSVDNIQINGDKATAQVTRTANGRREASNMDFLREDGRWTICGANPGQ